MFWGKNDLTFKARIRVGAKIGQDFAWGEWPWCKAPGGKEQADNPDMEFDAAANDTLDQFQLKAWGYGVLGTHDGKGYGNGSITVYGLDGLIIDNATRKKLHAKKRALIEAKKAELCKEMAKLDAELATVS